jgi:DNA-binding SARP family transcriptional activator
MHLVSHVRIQQDGVVGIDAGDIAFVRVLGPIQVVTTSGRALDLPSVSQRRLLARLAVDAPRALRVDLLCDVLAVSPGALRTTVSRLRRGFGDTTVVGSQGRYRLTAAVDAALFTTSLSQVGAGDDRIGTLERALALWTGPAFDEFSAEAWATPEATRLAELRASAIEDHAAELIVARRWAEAVAELKAHVSANPLRDRPWGLLVQALGGAGRQADALAAFQEYRAYLAEWVGTEPSAEVRRIQRRIAEGWDGIKAGWEGIEERDLPVRSGSAPLAGPPSWPGNGWLPLQAELARGTAVVGRACELELLAAEAALVGESGSRRARRESARRPCWARSPGRYETRAQRPCSTGVARTGPPCPWNRSAH